MKADFVMTVHFHQPVGNFDSVIERASDRCYIPFLETLGKYPGIKMSLHFSGCLLEWAEEKRPEIFNLVREMVTSGQIELLSGGFYEPILPSIPPRDATRQIKMLTKYIQEKFSYNPEGAWLAERVWEPSLAPLLYDAGIKYTTLDDTHFLYSGISKDKTYGYYLVGDDAKPVSIFPLDKTLRYCIPFRMPEECMDYMRGVSKVNSNPLFVYSDDGEKFGEWPGTHKWVFEEKWIQKFFDELMKNAGWLNALKLSECLKERLPEGKVDLSPCSYEEMIEWAIPARSRRQLEEKREELSEVENREFYKPFIKEGVWRNFLVKYPEVGHMHKRMVYVSERLRKIQETEGETSFLLEAEKNLFKGQCNCAYWHGIFGGLYLYHLRSAIYENLIKSGVLIDKIVYGEKQFCESVILDVDADGQPWVLLENQKQALYVDPSVGGTLKELDSKEIFRNFTNTLARREEAYHKKILEGIESGGDIEAMSTAITIHDDIQKAGIDLKNFSDAARALETNAESTLAKVQKSGYLNYDWYERSSLIDHFFGKDVDINAFSRCIYDETGDFVKGKYNFDVKKTSEGVYLIMEREGLVSGSRIHITKKITLSKKESFFTVEYNITNRDSKPLETVFGSEFNITMPDADSERYSLVLDDVETGRHLGDIVQHDVAQRIEIRDKGKESSFEIVIDSPCRTWQFPVKTVSQSPKAYEFTYQGTAILPHLELKMAPGEEKEISFQVKLTV